MVRLAYHCAAVHNIVAAPVARLRKARLTCHVAQVELCVQLGQGICVIAQEGRVLCKIVVILKELHGKTGGALLSPITDEVEI